jgi:hypothetical protein
MPTKSWYYYYYLGAKIPEATILYNESKHNILALISKANNNKDVHTHTNMETTVERKLDPYSSVAKNMFTHFALHLLQQRFLLG